MSYTTTYQLYKTKVVPIREHRNGHGSGPAIWDYISVKLRGHPFSYSDNDADFWPLYKDSRLDRDEQAVLLSTYDYAYVEAAKLAQFAAAARKLHALIIDNTRWQWNHFSAIADDAENLAKGLDRRCLGMCISCTSVSDIWDQDVRKLEPWGVYGLIEQLEVERVG